MGIRIVTPTNDEEWEPFDRVIASSFGEAWEDPKPEAQERAAVEAPFALRVGVMVDDTVAGGCSSAEFDLTLPGGRAVPVAGLTGVGANPTTRGRGVFQAMVVEHLERARQRGHAASTLMASEAGLYGRFGYGHATTMVGYEIDSDRADFRTRPQDAGELEIVSDLLGSIDLFHDAYHACAKQIPGTASRNDLWWQAVLGEKEGWRGGGKQLGVIHRDPHGDPDGYLLYKLKDGPEWIPNGALVIKELLGASVATELALVRFACDVPLQRQVRWPEGPIDHPVRHHLADPRQLHVIDQHDLLWLRPLDVVALLSGRTYAADASVVIAVDDDLFADQRGPWRVDIVDGAASVTSSEDPPEVTFTPGQLGMILLGDHRVQDLVHAGVLTGDPAAVQRLDLAFLTDRRPYNLSKF